MGAARETLQVMSYEPMVLLMAVAFFQVTGSFDVAAAFGLPHPAVCTIGLVFLGVLFILTIKLRKSPFDLALSHHAHQEIVRGVTTEMSGSTLGLVEIMHWCENVLFMGWIGLFFVWGGPHACTPHLVPICKVPRWRSCTSWRYGSTTTSPA